MSTFTPNYNLEKPDNGDAFSLFRALFNDNMDIIDANLGGGEETTDLFSILDIVRVDARYSTASIVDNQFVFSMDENANDWSCSATATNNNAVDLTDFDKLRLTITLSDRADYGYFWITLSQTKYTWDGYTWPYCYRDENSSIKIDSDGTYEVDVSLLSGNYYIYIGATTGKATTSAGDCNNSLNGRIAGTVTSFVGVAEASGSSVIANPAGVPTDTLQSVEIEGVIYSIPSEGGGGGGAQIVDFSSFTKLYDDTIPFGNNGAKIDTALGFTNEVLIALNMQAGWNAPTSAYYDSENQIGAYGGYNFNSAIELDHIRVYMGRYSGQNLDLVVTVQYLDNDGVWHDVEDMNISTSINYPICSFDISFSGLGKVHGVRWYHYKNPQKSPSNNICFFGMLMYKAGNGGGYSVDYSTTEREIGSWIDGRTVYDITYTIGTPISCSSQVWTDTGISKGAIKSLLSAQIISEDGTVYNCTNVNLTTNTDHIGIYNGSLETISVKYIVVQYFKNEMPQNLHLIEYIEGTGTQWLKTGIKPTLTTVVQVGIYPRENTGEVLVGNCADDGSDYRLFNYGGSLYFDYAGERMNGDSLPENTYSEVELGNYYVDKNGVQVLTHSPVTTTGTYSNNDIYFLYKQDNQSVSKARLYYLKIYNNGNLVFDGVPVKDANGVPCLFDYVSINYIYNMGTGDFLAGPDIP